MEILEAAMALASLVLLSSIISQLIPKVPVQLIQVILGAIAASAVPFLFGFQVDSEVFLTIFVAPLLFIEAKNADKLSILKHRKSIAILATIMVGIVTIAIGGLSAFAIGMPLALAISLGASLAPTDAVSVSSMNGSLKTENKAILSGESLFNDATGVVLFQFAVIAAVTGVFNPIDAVSSFAISFTGGILCGAVLAVIGNLLVSWVRKMGLENMTFHIMLDLCMPFFVYAIAIAAGVSGMIAVVSAGLVFTLSPHLNGPAISKMNVASQSVWKVLSFVLNGMVFTMLGSNIAHAVLSSTSETDIPLAILLAIAVAINIVILAIRFFWFMVSCKDKDKIKQSAVFALGGAKGAISMSVIMTLPYSVPMREDAVFITASCILISMLLADFVLPIIVGKTETLHNETTKCGDDEERKIKIGILRRVVSMIESEYGDSKSVSIATEKWNSRIARLNSSIDDETFNSEVATIRMECLESELQRAKEISAEEKTDSRFIKAYINRIGAMKNYLEINTAPKAMSFNNMHILVKKLARNARMFIPVGTNKPGKSEEEARIYRECYQSAIEKLNTMKFDAKYEKTAVASVYAEYSKAINRLYTDDPSITSIQISIEEADKIIAAGLEYEDNLIQDAYENKRIEKEMAQVMRNNIMFMKLDLYDAI